LEVGLGVSHPARFSPEILEALRPVLSRWDLPVHDPFGGTGERMGALCDELGIEFTGTEIEPEFVVDHRVRPGDSTEARTYPAGPYVVATSPTYPNGMADHFRARDASKRHTYRQGLAEIIGHDRPLKAHNTGRYGVRRGSQALDTYWTLEARCVDHWPDRVAVNVSDCVTGGQTYPVADRWRDLLESRGYLIVETIQVATRRQRNAANADLRAEHEVILVAERPGRAQARSPRPTASSVSQAILEHGVVEVWAVDTEFEREPGERPVPVCLVARELRSGRLVRLWRDELGPEPPFTISAEALFIAYAAEAEWAIFLELGWPLPANIIDAFTEFKITVNNGLPFHAHATGLLDACEHYGLEHASAAEKESGRALALKGSWTEEERDQLLDYCQGDVDALASLLEAMRIDMPKALQRGRYTAAVARMESAGIPVDVDSYRALYDRWGELRGALIADVDDAFGVFVDDRFSFEEFAAYLSAEKITGWPRTDSGRLAIDAETLEDQVRIHPQLEPLTELVATLNVMKQRNLAVGRDGRNRARMWPYGTRTGRNAPKASEFAFSLPSWMRGLIRPEPGSALAYVDWSSQEVAIAAKLSGDKSMLEAVASGDPYLDLARRAGRAPRGATRESHPQVRDRFKAAVLAPMYGMGAPGLARKIGRTESQARQLLRALARAFPVYWDWAKAQVEAAQRAGSIASEFGWSMTVGPETRVTQLRNFPCQSNGAEMMRLASIMVTEAGIALCATVHDALLVEAAEGEIEDVAAATRTMMAKASAEVLDGLEVATDAKIVRERFSTEPMWERVLELLRRPAAAPRQRDRLLEATYDYVDAAGALQFQSVRLRPIGDEKRFRVRHPDGNGAWSWRRPPGSMVLYHLPQLLEGIKAGTTIHVCEGERDVHSLEALGEVATTNALGASVWTTEHSKTLKGAARIIVHRDRDQAGRDRVEKVSRSLGQALILRSRRDVGEILIADPALEGEADDGADVTDHLEAGWSLSELILTPFDYEPRQEAEPAPESAGSSSERPRRDGAGDDHAGDHRARGGGLIDAFFGPISWAQLLEPAGWNLVRADVEGKQYWRHPEATCEWSATTGHGGVPTLVCFSENAGLPVGEGQKLTKFRVWAHLQFDGDESAAARTIARWVRERSS
jgi:hypothetical protein